jgi:hypothetical protein
MITYPDKPWEDGQTFKTIDSNGEEVVGTYDASKNAWTFTRLQEGGAKKVVLVVVMSLLMMSTHLTHVLQERAVLLALLTIQTM